MIIVKISSKKKDKREKEWKNFSKKLRNKKMMF